MITVASTQEPFDHVELYRAFVQREDDSTGTVVLHHGRVKRPGKQIENFSAVELRPLVVDVDERLAGIARLAIDEFGVHQVLIVHRLGTIGAGESVLLAIVSSTSRGPAFAACSWIVDQVKKEEFIELIELP
ncbi:MAG TPA: molybdenum cofactor biosynthesis protein MoaE [bacterium]|nr:molybdenum cofactor biosynthesis protein MoaE [bacterium]